jgi:hypothetical protein
MQILRVTWAWWETRYALTRIFVIMTTVLTRWQYNILLSIWYIPIVFFGPPMNILTKKYGAALILPIAGAGTFAHIYSHLNGEIKIS